MPGFERRSKSFLLLFFKKEGLSSGLATGMFHVKQNKND
jgi:hypothetical protein